MSHRNHANMGHLFLKSYRVMLALELTTTHHQVLLPVEMLTIVILLLWNLNFLAKAFFYALLFGLVF